MKAVPMTVARSIAHTYGYDQVIIYARKTGDDPQMCGEHMTTYGVTKTHCNAIARIGDFLKYKIMGWVQENEGKEKNT